MSGHEAVVATRRHDSGIVLYKRECVDIQVVEHGVAAPTTEDTNLIGVDATKQEGHCTTGAE